MKSLLLTNLVKFSEQIWELDSIELKLDNKMDNGGETVSRDWLPQKNKRQPLDGRERKDLKKEKLFYWVINSRSRKFRFKLPSDWM